MSDSFDCAVDCFFLPLYGQNLPDLVVVEDIRRGLLLKLRELDQQVHAAVFLGDKLLVAGGLEDLSLEHDRGDDDAVQEL